MNSASKAARLRLRMSTRAEFERLIFEAMLTPMDEHIIRLYIVNDLSVPIIAMRMAVSEACVRKHLTEIYEKVAKV
jgi:predicted DNA-binding protein YlxM (UPF0122 family)